MNDAFKQINLAKDIETRTAVFGKFKSGDDISISLIQRRCLVEYFTALRTLDNLIEDGLVEKNGQYQHIYKFI
jgi:hypothetical protein